MPPEPRYRRYPYRPLERLIVHRNNLDLAESRWGPSFLCGRLAAETFGVSHRTIMRWAQVGLTAHAALTVAERAGEHPYLLWPEMRDHDIYDLAERHRASARRSWRRRWARMTDEEKEAKRAYAREYRSAAREAQLRRRRRTCAASDCTVVFVAERGDQRYHSTTCRRREKMRRYRAPQRSEAA